MIQEVFIVAAVAHSEVPGMQCGVRVDGHPVTVRMAVRYTAPAEGRSFRFFAGEPRP